MKKTLIGFLVFALAMGLFMTGCSDSSGDSGDDPVIVTSNSVKVNGFPIWDTDDYDGDLKTFNNPWDTFSMNDAFDAHVALISGGKLTINLGIPNNEVLSSLSNLDFDDSDYTVDAKVLFIFNFYHENGSQIWMKEKGYSEYCAELVYVDRDTVLNCTYESLIFDMEYIFSNVKLTKGWNTVLADWDTLTITSGKPGSNYEWVMDY